MFIITDTIASSIALFVLLSISDVTTPQGLLAVVAKKKNTNKINYNEDIIIALDGIQDPGNLGTILRTVDSADLKQIILSKNSEQKDENDVESNEEQLPTTEPEIVENIEEVQEVEETQKITENKETIEEELTTDEAQIEEEKNAIDTLANDETANGEVSANAETGEITQEDINIFNLQKSVNQYVWVPVKDISRIYGVDSNGKLWGKLWNFPSSATGSRTAYNWMN